MGEVNGRANGKQVGPTHEERVEAKLKSNQRQQEAQKLCIEWMRMHEDPAIRDIKDPSIFDMLRLLVEHVVKLEMDLAELRGEAPKVEESRIIMPGG